MKRYIRTAIVSVNDESDETKRELALAHDTGARDLAALANDSDRYIRRTVSENHNLPMDARLKLMEDPDVDPFPVIYYGDFSAEFLDELAHRPDGHRFMQAISQHRNVSPETLAWIADNCYDRYVLSGVAGNKNTPPEALAKLAKSYIYELRMRVANNPHTPIEVLKNLANDRQSVQVRRYATSTLERLGEL